MFNFAEYMPFAHRISVSVIWNITIFLIPALVVLEFTRMFYAAATDNEPISLWAPFIKTAIFGTILIYPFVYIETMDMFIVNPIMAIQNHIINGDGSAESALAAMQTHAQNALSTHSKSVFSWLLSVMKISVLGLLSYASYGLMWAILYAILKVQKVLWLMLYIVGPIFAPFIIFKPLSSFFTNWLKAFLSVSFWSLFAAILIKVLYAMGISDLVDSSFSDDFNGIRVLIVCIATIFMSISFVSLCSQIFNISLFSPFGAMQLFAIPGAIAFKATQFMAKRALSKTALKDKILSQSKDTSAKASSAAKDKIRGVEEFQVPDITDKLKSGAESSFKDRLLGRARSISDLLRDKTATMDDITERTARVQAGLFRNLVTKFALAKNPFIGSVNKVFFNGENAFEAASRMGWVLSGRKGKFEITNELVTPIKFSNISNKNDYLDLCKKMKHFSHLKEEGQLEILNKLSDSGYGMWQITKAMEILDHNFKDFGNLDNASGMIQKVIDINTKKDFEQFLEKKYGNSTDSDLWRYFRQEDKFTGIDGREMKKLLSLFSPGFILASAQYLNSHSKSLNKDNALFMLKSFLANNKIYDKLSADEHLGINRYVKFGHVQSLDSLEFQLRKSALFSKLSNKQVEAIARGRDIHNVSVIADFADKTIKPHEVDNPYLLLKKLVDSYEEIREAALQKRPINVTKEDILKLDVLDIKEVDRLLNKYSVHAVNTAVCAIKDSGSPSKPLFSRETTPKIREEIITRTLKASGIVNTQPEILENIVKMVVLNPKSIERINEKYIDCLKDAPVYAFPADAPSETITQNLITLENAGVFNNLSPSQIAYVINDAISTGTLKKSSVETLKQTYEGVPTEHSVFKSDDTQEYKTHFVSKFVSSGGFKDVPTNKAVMMMSYIRQNETSIENITPSFVTGLKDQPLLFTPEHTISLGSNVPVPLERRGAVAPAPAVAPIETIAALVDGGLLNGTSSEKINSIITYVIQENTPKENITSDYVNSLKEAAFSHGKSETTGNVRISIDENPVAGAVEAYLEDNYKTLQTYNVSASDAVSFINHRTDFNVQESFIPQNIPPQQAIGILKSLNESIGLSVFKTADELKAVVSEVTEKKTTIGEVIKQKAADLKANKDDAARFVKSLPLFASVPDIAVQEWFLQADPLKVMTLARDFTFDVDGLKHVDVESDFNLYIEDKLPRMKQDGGS